MYPIAEELAVLLERKPVESEIVEKIQVTKNLKFSFFLPI
jgi:hypothetical protein